jgi:hypothetical protein
MMPIVSALALIYCGARLAGYMQRRKHRRPVPPLWFTDPSKREWHEITRPPNERRNAEVFDIAEFERKWNQ